MARGCSPPPNSVSARTTILDDKPVRVTLELPAALHRDLVAYAEALSRETGQTVEPARLVAPMLERFLAGDRGFRTARSGAVQRHSPYE